MHLQKPQIIIIPSFPDDDEINLETLQRRIDCTVLENPEELSQELFKEPLQLVIINAFDPETNPTDIIYQIRAHPTAHDIPLLICCESDPELMNSLIHLYKSGNVDFILRPFHKEAILNRIETFWDIALQKSINVEQMKLLESQRRESSQLNNQLEKALERANNMALEAYAINQRLKELDHEKNEFLGIAAHDLKNPICSIRGIASIMECDPGMGEDQIKEMSEMIGHTSELMLELITNLLDINKIEQGQIELNLKELNLRLIADEVIKNYEKRAESKEQKIIISSPENLPLIKIDKRITIQIMENLISNALKFSPKGKEIQVILEANEEHVLLSVKDEGPGLSEDDLSKLFGKFVRLSAQPTGGENSTGLGLSIVKKLVEAMRGNVWCESELGHGATFKVSFPILKEASS